MRVKLGLLGALVCLGAPAAAQNFETRTADALAVWHSGRTQEAIILFEQLSRERPNDPTVLRLLGTTYAAAHRYPEASAVLAQAQKLAPKDQDIALARARAALWSDRLGDASEIADAIAAVEPGNVELAQLRTSINAARRLRPGIGFTASQSLSRVSSAGPRQTWLETLVGLGAPLDGRTTASAEIERSDRSGIEDTRLGARVDRRFRAGGSAYLAGHVTPGADFRERWSLQAGGEARLTGAVAVTFDARHAEYGTANITALEPGVRFETAGARLAVSARSINLWDEAGDHRFGWAGRLDGTPSERLRLFAGGASYPGTEAGVTRRVRGLFAGADLSLTNALSLRMTVDHERRVETYRRTGLSIGLRWRPQR